MDPTRRDLFALGGVTVVALLLPGCANTGPADTNPECYTPAGCSPSADDLPEGTLLNGVAQDGETQWDVIRRLWPQYAPSDLAFMVFDPKRGYVFPDEIDFDNDWNYVCVEGENVLFLAIATT